ncbi:FAD:protein FMN transferase [Jannaschia pagri]|uniref:FAD:protein FMN transferase n=1 Tax=Jannaschia pagri TaxID=2829797 RepID=A0ABQ4NN70_9RHOB|nr:MULTISPECIES: FAD:protein FMN transferase [unclassified Jannaschia]GIT91728.1 FAD:protein FMN transferase [Jannaschia sp. AI_61]GIT95562.1 FAD:protein FMN transferase [Jannaschia sp. AI_62]
MKRRRFLAVAAGFAAFPAFAGAPLRWEGIALGAHARMELSAPDSIARPALAAALAEIEAVEAAFSIYRDDSILTQLNRVGRLDGASTLFERLFESVDRIHRLTNGLFDPSVQPVWEAQRDGTKTHSPTIGWGRVRRPKRGTIELAPGQALTFNGIAQGFATDRVVAVLRAHGLSDAFVNIGEQAALGRPRRLGVVDPTYGRVGDLTLRGGAVATSSPLSTAVGQVGHIINPRRLDAQPLWSTVTVESETATLSDGLSTALVHGDLALARDLAGHARVRRVLLVDHAGSVRTFG